MIMRLVALLGGLLLPLWPAATALAAPGGVVDDACRIVEVAAHATGLPVGLPQPSAKG